MSRIIPLEALSCALALLVVFGSRNVTAGLEEAQVAVFGLSPKTAPNTSSWDQLITLQDGNITNFAQLNGDMASLGMSTSAQLTSVTPSNVRVAQATADLIFRDALTLEAPGIPDGTDLKVRIAWKVSGSGTVANDSTFDFILAQTSLRLTGPGSQVWQRVGSDPGASTLDPFGEVVFEFDIKEAVPEDENVRLIVNSASQCAFLNESIMLPSPYSSEAASNMTVDFCGIVDVRTPGGTEIGLWTVTSESGLDYGEGTSAPSPVDPEVFIIPSPDDAGFVRLSWQSSLFEEYTVEGRSGPGDWTSETPVPIPGDDSVLILDLPRTDPLRLFRVESALKPSS